MENKVSGCHQKRDKRHGNSQNVSDTLVLKTSILGSVIMCRCVIGEGLLNEK